MISSALLCDAAIGNVQEKSMKAYKATNTEVVLYSYSIGFVYLFLIMLVTGDLGKGIEFCSTVGSANTVVLW
jgi:adenosine 3'-phospho 5'-phosphosulfate transporter B3